MGHKHRMFSLFWILWTNCLTFLAVFSLFLVSTRLSIVLAYKLLFISVSVDLQVCLLHYFASFINQFISLLSWSVFYNYLSTKQIVYVLNLKIHILVYYYLSVSSSSSSAPSVKWCHMVQVICLLYSCTCKECDLQIVVSSIHVLESLKNCCKSLLPGTSI